MATRTKKSTASAKKTPAKAASRKRTVKDLDAKAPAKVKGGAGVWKTTDGGRTWTP